jgi:hypothetical protein
MYTQRLKPNMSGSRCGYILWHAAPLVAAGVVSCVEHRYSAGVPVRAVAARGIMLGSRNAQMHA